MIGFEDVQSLFCIHHLVSGLCPRCLRILEHGSFPFPKFVVSPVQDFEMETRHKAHGNGDEIKHDLRNQQRVGLW